MVAISADYSGRTKSHNDCASTKTSDPFLAKPSGECCLKGSIHEGQPRGHFKTIANVETYIIRPGESKANGHIILYFPDVWGLFNNGLLIMDGFADAGYLVLGLDYFRGVSVARIARIGPPTYVPRILSGSIERTDTITRIQTSTMKLGKRNILRLLISLSQSGSRRSKNSMESLIQSMRVLGESAVNPTQCSHFDHV
jgi:hypothetical protein